MSSEALRLCDVSSQLQVCALACCGHFLSHTAVVVKHLEVQLTLALLTPPAQRRRRFTEVVQAALAPLAGEGGGDVCAQPNAGVGMPVST